MFVFFNNLSWTNAIDDIICFYCLELSSFLNLLHLECEVESNIISLVEKFVWRLYLESFPLPAHCYGLISGTERTRLTSNDERYQWHMQESERVWYQFFNDERIQIALLLPNVFIVNWSPREGARLWSSIE